MHVLAHTILTTRFTVFSVVPPKMLVYNKTYDYIVKYYLCNYVEQSVTMLYNKYTVLSKIKSRDINDPFIMLTFN